MTMIRGGLPAMVRSELVDCSQEFQRRIAGLAVGKMFLLIITSFLNR